MITPPQLHPPLLKNHSHSSAFTRISDLSTTARCMYDDVRLIWYTDNFIYLRCLSAFSYLFFCVCGNPYLKGSSTLVESVFKYVSTSLQHYWRALYMLRWRSHWQLARFIWVYSKCHSPPPHLPDVILWNDIPYRCAFCVTCLFFLVLCFGLTLLREVTPNMRLTSHCQTLFLWVFF